MTKIIKNKNFKYLLLSVLLILTLTILILNGCTKKFSPYSKTDILLDTVVRITVYSEKDSNKLDDIFLFIEKLESTLSLYKDGSDFVKIKNQAYPDGVNISDDAISIIKKSIYYSELSGGLFDISSGPLIDLWSIGSPEERIPQQSEIETVLDYIDYKKIHIEGNMVFLENENMYLNTGAIAKGYIADKIKEKMLDMDIENGIINLGGNVLTIATKPDGKGYRIGIQDPDTLRGDHLAIVTLNDSSVVSSGDYERYFIVDNIRYHHILNPFTGYPENNNLRAVSILSKNSIDGDALSTTIFLMGLVDGINLIESIDDVEAIFITKDKQLYLTSGIKDIEITNNEYEAIYK